MIRTYGSLRFKSYVSICRITFIRAWLFPKIKFYYTNLNLLNFNINIKYQIRIKIQGDGNSQNEE